MELTSNSMWMVRAGRDGAYYEHFLNHGVVAIGWAGKIGEIKPGDTDEVIWRRFAEAYPDDKPGQIRNGVSQVKRFLREAAIDDNVVTYNSERRVYRTGVIRSDAEVQTRSSEIDAPRAEYVRRVDWRADEIPRDALTATARGSLASMLTIFRVNDETSRELRNLCSPSPTREPAAAVAPLEQPDEAQTAYTLAEYIEKSEQFIEDQIVRLGPYQMQDLIAGILRAMGYRTRVADPGPDRGVDIFASPDGLGLAEPRIFAEVKHRAGTTGAPALRAFMGGRQPGDRCLYVSTGGFTREARYEAERSSIPLTLLAMPELRTLLLDYYEQLDLETRRLVPLRRIYWPTGDE